VKIILTDMREQYGTLSEMVSQVRNTQITLDDFFGAGCKNTKRLQKRGTRENISYYFIKGDGDCLSFLNQTPTSTIEERDKSFDTFWKSVTKRRSKLYHLEIGESYVFGSMVGVE
jgi:hypothetical protein